MDSEKQILANNIKIYGTIFIIVSIVAIFCPLLFIITPIYYLITNPKENWNYDASDEEIKKSGKMYYTIGLIFTFIAGAIWGFIFGVMCAFIIGIPFAIVLIILLMIHIFTSSATLYDNIVKVIK